MDKRSRRWRRNRERRRRKRSRRRKMERRRRRKRSRRKERKRRRWRWGRWREGQYTRTDDRNEETVCVAHPSVSLPPPQQHDLYAAPAHTHTHTHTHTQTKTITTTIIGSSPIIGSRKTTGLTNVQMDKTSIQHTFNPNISNA